MLSANKPIIWAAVMGNESAAMDVKRSTTAACTTESLALCYLLQWHASGGTVNVPKSTVPPEIEGVSDAIVHANHST